MSAPELCTACAMDEDDRQRDGRWCSNTCCPDASTCRDHLELFNDGVHTERARVRALLSTRVRWAGGAAILSRDDIAELLGGEGPRGDGA